MSRRSDDPKRRGRGEQKGLVLHSSKKERGAQTREDVIKGIETIFQSLRTQLDQQEELLLQQASQYFSTQGGVPFNLPQNLLSWSAPFLCAHSLFECNVCTIGLPKIRLRLPCAPVQTHEGLPNTLKTPQTSESQGDLSGDPQQGDHQASLGARRAPNTTSPHDSLLDRESSAKTTQDQSHSIGEYLGPRQAGGAPLLDSSGGRVAQELAALPQRSTPLSPGIQSLNQADSSLLQPAVEPFQALASPLRSPLDHSRDHEPLSASSSSNPVKIAVGWEQTGDRYENLCTGEIVQDRIPRIDALGTPVPLGGYPESSELDRCIAELTQVISHWLSAYEIAYGNLRKSIDDEAQSQEWFEKSGYIWGVCRLLKSLESLSAVELPTSNISAAHRWTKLFEFKKNLSDPFEIQLHLIPAPKDTTFSLEPFESHEPAVPCCVWKSSGLFDSNPVVQAIWESLMDNSSNENLALVNSIFKLSICSRLIQPRSKIDFSTIGRKISFRKRFFDSLGLMPASARTKERFTIIIIPAVVSEDWPNFFVAKGKVA